MDLPEFYARVSERPGHTLCVCAHAASAWCAFKHLFFGGKWYGIPVFLVCIPLLIKSPRHFDFPQGPIPVNTAHCDAG